MKKRYLLILAVVGIATLASGHMLYAEYPQDISTDSEMDVWITYGHSHGEKTVPDLSVAEVVSPDGDVNELDLDEYNDGLTATVEIDEPGCYILNLQMEPNFVDLAWYGVSGDKELILNYGRGLMTVESGDNYDWSSGEGLEIVPLVDPYGLEAGDDFRAEVFWNGESIDGDYNAVIVRTPSDLLTIQHAVAEEYDAEGYSSDGKIEFELTRPGLWVITFFADTVEESGTWTATNDDPEGHYTQGDELDYDAIAPTAYLTFWSG